MNQTVLFSWFVDIAGIALILGVYNFLWKQQRVDRLREQLFLLRDELFDLATVGEVSFNDPAYTQLRLLINGTIRFAHKATFRSLFLTRIFVQNKKSSVFERWKDSLKSLHPQTRKKIENIHFRVFSAFTAHIVGGSVVLMSLTIFIGCVLIARALFRTLIGNRRLEITKGIFDRVHDKAARKAVDVTNSQPEQLESVFIDEGLRASQQNHHAYV